MNLYMASVQLRKQSAEPTDSHRVGENLHQLCFTQGGNTQNLQRIAEIRPQVQVNAAIMEISVKVHDTRNKQVQLPPYLLKHLVTVP